MAEGELTIAIGRALRLIEAHPSVKEVLAATSEGSSEVEVLVSIETELPNSWRAAGQSPSGVKRIEDVTFVFDERFPIDPPKIHLRADFNRSHPHIQPGPPEAYPEPCLFAGSLRELLRLRGMAGVVDQMVEWLDRASRVELIDPKQGWEPTRRDHIEDVVVANADWLRGLVDRDGGCSAFPVRYLATLDAAKANYWIMMRRSEPAALSPEIASVFTFRERSSDARSGSGIGLVAWSGKLAGGGPFIADRYMPETVHSIAGLLDRADALGCRAFLEPKLTLLESRVRDSRMRVPVPLAVVIIARRPCPVIGTGSVLELVPFVVEIDGRDDFSKKSTKMVRPAMHRDDISASLLRAASGRSVDEQEAGEWGLIGCGSVGSKMAIHLARQGRGPRAVVDRSCMSPHNFSRHATFPAASATEHGLLSNKTAMVSEALSALAQPAEQHPVDIIQHMQKNASLKPIVSAKTTAVLNTTGSATVREALGSRSLCGDRPRVVEACLLGVGKVALLTAEGENMNPSTVDLVVEAYGRIHERSQMARDVFGTEGSEVPVGQGCAALTMPLSDSRLSMFAAALADKFAGYQLDGLPIGRGEIALGHLHADGLSTSWERYEVQPFIRVAGAGAEIRISSAVDETIRSEVGRRQGSETGGIIYGRYSELSDSFHIVGTLPAPPDSKFSANEFVLGVEGLKPTIEQLTEGTSGALYPLGTWHNHLVTSGPSMKDMRTAALLSGRQYFPLLMLIHTPAGYSVLTVETIRGVSSGSADETSRANATT